MTGDEEGTAAIERRLAVLEDERDIARLIASYGPLVDAGDADGAAALWMVDGHYDAGDWQMSGRDDVAAMVRSDAHQGLITRGCCHFFGPPVVEVSGDDAVAVCQSTVLVRRVARQLDGTGAGPDLIAGALRRDQDGG